MIDEHLIADKARYDRSFSDRVRDVCPVDMRCLDSGIEHISDGCVQVIDVGGIQGSVRNPTVFPVQAGFGSPPPAAGAEAGRDSR
jgi:hypothetical protein